MKQAVDILPEESSYVEELFLKYNSYMSMLEYLASANVSNSEIYSKKWEETSDLWIALDKAKTAVEMKYRPEGQWDRYEFDFDHSQVVFTKDEA